MMSTRSTRRAFLARSAAGMGAAAGLLVLPSFGRSPNEKLNVAVIGVAGRGAANLEGVSEENIVALCDVDEKNLAAAAAKRFPKAKTYADFRKMLDEIEHADRRGGGQHARPHPRPGRRDGHGDGQALLLREAADAHVYEARAMAELAKKNKLATQMGTQIHAGDNYRRVVELVQAGAIGPVGEVHVWGGASYGGGERPKDTPPGARGPRLGPLARPGAERPYHPVLRARQAGAAGGTSAPAAWATSAATTWTCRSGR